MKPQLTVVKVGGNVLDDAADCARFLDLFAALEGPKVLIHGGGKLATRLAEQLGLTPVMIDGRRVTDAEMLKVVTMVYGGLANRELVAGLQARGCDAIGLTGADANLIRATRRPPQPIDFGFAGDITPASVNTFRLQQWMNTGLVPVLAPLTHDGMGSLLNTNADTLAATVAIALTRYYTVHLRFCFEKAGVLRDINDAGSLIPAVSGSEIPALTEQGIIAKGMLPKLKNATEAAQAGVAEVWVGHWTEVSKPAPVGTRIMTSA